MAEAVAGSTWQREFPLNSQASSHAFQTPPTIASGDFKRSIVTAGGTVGALTNLDNLPTIDPAGSVQVKIILSASETTAAGDGGHINIIGVDASGAEWDPIFISVDVVASLTNTRASDIQSRLPAALVSGRIDASVGAMASGVVTATAIAADAIDADALAADAVTEIQSGLLTTSAFNTKLGTPAGASVSADIAAVKAETASIQSDTNDLQTQIGTAGAGLTAVASAANLATLTGYVDTEVAAIKAKTDNLPASPAATGVIPSASSIAAAVWAYVVEGAYTAVQVYRIIAAVLAGESTGGGTTSVAFRDIADSKNRVSATVDGDGNRTAVTLDGS